MLKYVAPLLASIFLNSLALGYVGGMIAGDLLPATVGIVMVGADCTGVKVAEHIILTSAHCNRFGSFKVNSEITLVNFKGSEEKGSFIKTKIKSFTPHPSWKNIEGDQLTYSDVALLEVEDLSIFPSAKISLKPLSEGDVVVVGGFGAKGLHYPNYPDLTVAMKKVQKLLKFQFEVTVRDFNSKTMSMAGDGDSGGPAWRFIKSTNSFEVVGVNHVVDHSLEQLTVNKDSGALESYLGPEPLFFVTRLDINDGENSVSQWLLKFLPKDSFNN